MVRGLGTLPPEHHVFRLAKGLLGVDGDNDVGTLFVHRHVKARVGRIRSVVTTGLHNPLFHLLAQISQEGKGWGMLVRAVRVLFADSESDVLKERKCTTSCRKGPPW
jgi:hypothetical protein